MTPFEQLVQSLEVERMRPTPPRPSAIPQLPADAAPELSVRRLVREVAPAPEKAYNRALRERLKKHAQVRWTVLTDAEIEAI